MRTTVHCALLHAAIIVVSGSALAQPSPDDAQPPAAAVSASDGDDGVPTIEEVRNPVPPPEGVVDVPDGDGEPSDGAIADAFDETGDEAVVDDTTEVDDGDTWGEEGWDDDVPPLATPDSPRRARKAFIHPTLPPVADRESWSVAAGIQLGNSLATTLVIEARPFSDLWIMARGQAGAEQRNSDSTTLSVGPPAFSTTVDTSALSLGASAGLGARYGFRFTDLVEVSPVAWVSGGISGRRNETSTNTGSGNDPLNPNTPLVSTNGDVAFFGAAALGATAEVFLLENLSLRLSADVVEGVLRADGLSTSSGTAQNVLTELSSTSIGLRVLPRAGFSLRIIF